LIRQPTYPAERKLQRFFAHRFVRILHKSCAAQDIGPAACYLLCVIAHTEDAGRYAGPARFWRSQLMETLGFRSPKQLVIARNRAIESGWLAYHQGGTRAVGEYFVTIPERFSGLSDSAIEPPEDLAISSASGTNEPIAEVGLVPLRDLSRNGNGSISGTQSGPLPNPNPIPSPTPSLSQACDGPENGKPKKPRNDYPEAFEEFWQVYPTRNGRRSGKANSFTLWKKIPAADRPAVLAAAENFSRSGLARDDKARDPERFLKGDWWRDWVETPAATQAASIYKDLQ
jgi:hypothetical protein